MRAIKECNSSRLFQKQHIAIFPNNSKNHAAYRGIKKRVKY
jgi:hypothetical protein